MRILIAGPPRVGKTTLAGKLATQLGIKPLHTDDLIGKHAWSGASDETRLWIEQPGPWVIEGCAIVRAIRKWLRIHPEGKPSDALYLSTTARVTLSKGQATTTKGHASVWADVKDELDRRGLHPIEF